MKINLKKYIPILLISFSIMILFGTSYALLRDSSKGENPYVIKVGLLEISFIDSETNTLTLSNSVPISDEEGLSQEQELTFTIKNTGTLPALYNVYIEETSIDMEFKSVIKYVSNKNDTGYGSIKTLSLDNYIDKKSSLDVGESVTYKVKLWLAETADSTYMNKTFSARIVVDTILKTQESGVQAYELVTENVITYEEASSDTFTGGLVAINTEGTLYNEKDSTQTIREYRYSGASVNNYITFNDGEMWRILGIFRNDAGEWNLKIIRDSFLESDILPDTYTYNGTTFTIKLDTDGSVDYNSTVTATYQNDWTTAGLQYYLNGTDGYYGTLSSGSQLLIDKSYTYYLGNVTIDPLDYTIETIYNDERNTANITSGNQPIWNNTLYPNANGIALVYLSDVVYTNDVSNWNDGSTNNSWLTKTISGLYMWTLSPFIDVEGVILLCGTVALGQFTKGNEMDVTPVGAKPCVNLLATAPIDINHLGTESDPGVM